MKKSALLTMISGVAVLLSAVAGCASTAVEKKPDEAAKVQHFTPASTSAARETAERFVKAFAEAMMTNDYLKLSEDVRQKITASRFEQMISVITARRGKLTGYSFVTELDQTVVRDYLWKFSFLKDPAEAGGKAIRTEVIYLVRTGMIKGVPMVVGFGFSR